MQYPLPNLNNSTQAFHTTQATQVFHTTQYVTHATECISQLAQLKALHFTTIIELGFICNL